MPMFVREPVPAGVAAAPAVLAAFRNCRLQAYRKIKVAPVRVRGEIVAYASPDSTYAVTKRLFDAASKSIRIGIYDFSAPHMKTLLVNAVARGVKVTLMLDVETGAGEDRLFRELIALGVEGVPAPSCTSERAQYFSACHEKFIVIDDTWTLVQSGNYSANSIPLNEKDGGDATRFVTGNRDTGLAVRSAALAKFFTQVLRSDIELELSAPPPPARMPRAATAGAEPLWVEAAPPEPPAQRFASRTFSLAAPLTVQPVLSPDNYMDLIPGVLAGARRSVLIEQQYIRSAQPLVAQLLAAIRSARENNPALDVRIVLGKIFGPEALKDERENLRRLAADYGLELGTHVRYVDTRRFVHLHNKMLIIDGATVLVSSQNWSDAAVSRNREAGLLLTHKGIAAYFTKLFESDWATAQTKLPAAGRDEVAPAALRAGGFLPVAPADYREV